MTIEQPQPALGRLASALEYSVGAPAVRTNESLARYTALRIGGRADLMLVAESVETLCKAVTLAWDQGIPCRVLGGGSNVLVSDAGVRGLVVLNRARGVSFQPEQGAPSGQRGGRWVRAESGASLSTVARRCVGRGLAGLEWAVGIPGSIGGAVVGNAGAWGSDMASCLVKASILEPGATKAEWPVERFAYSYRSSTLKGQAPHARQHAVVLGAEFALQSGNRSALEARAAEITAQRKASQPAGATCGSVFKNPAGDHAGRLIEAAGLKGHRRGRAEISPVHANFIVNLGGATAADVMALIDLAREVVRSQFGVALELEIELVGEWWAGSGGTVSAWRKKEQDPEGGSSTQGLVC